jgi:hypothetical protein
MLEQWIEGGQGDEQEAVYPLGESPTLRLSLSAIYQRFKSQTKMFDMLFKALSLGLTYGGARGIPGKAARQ